MAAKREMADGHLQTPSDLIFHDLNHEVASYRETYRPNAPTLLPESLVKYIERSALDKIENGNDIDDATYERLSILHFNLFHERANFTLLNWSGNISRNLNQRTLLRGFKAALEQQLEDLGPIPQTGGRWFVKSTAKDYMQLVTGLTSVDKITIGKINRQAKADIQFYGKLLEKIIKQTEVSMFPRTMLIKPVEP